MNNSEILKQIAALEGAIGKEKSKRKRTTSHIHSVSAYKPSRNLTLINNNNNTSTNSACSSSIGSPHIHTNNHLTTNAHQAHNSSIHNESAPTNLQNQACDNADKNKNSNIDNQTAVVRDQFIRKGNKLVRVGTASSKSLSKPVVTPLPIKKRKMLHPSANKRLVIVNGKSYQSIGNNKLIVSDLVKTKKKRSLKQSTRITIGGVDFIVKGKKLIRITDNMELSEYSNSKTVASTIGSTKTANALSSFKTPKKIELNGVQYLRTKSGNLIRAPQSKKWKKKSLKKYCQFYCRLGKCKSKPKCKYIHDSSRVTVCTRFLIGKCIGSNGETSIGRLPVCLFSHKPSEFNTPECIHVVTRNQCQRGSDCKYIHKETLGKKICQDFLNFGYCEKGETCEHVHFFTCPDFFEKGFCDNVKCRFRHDLDPKDAIYVDESLVASITDHLNEDLDIDQATDGHTTSDLDVLRRGQNSNHQYGTSSTEDEFEEGNDDEDDDSEVDEDPDDVSDHGLDDGESEDFLKIYVDSDDEHNEIVFVE